MSSSSSEGEYSSNHSAGQDSKNNIEDDDFYQEGVNDLSCF